MIPLILGLLFIINPQNIQASLVTDNVKKKCDIIDHCIDSTQRLIKEAAYLYWSLFSIDTAKILVGTAPFYISARMIDETLQNTFYDRSCHKNRRQFNGGFIEAVEKTAFAGSILLASFFLWAPEEHVRTTSRLFFIGWLSGLYFKDLIKCARTNANLRPWNEHFSCKKRAHGGFPSGHMFEASYMMTVWGLEYGMRAWIPLGIFASMMFVVSVNANRHYLSQTIAGTALGLIFGFATHKAIAYSDERVWTCDVSCVDRPEITVRYHF